MKVEAYSNNDNLNLKLVTVIGKNMKRISLTLANQLRSYNITAAQFSVLEAIYHKGPLTVNQIISKTFSTSGNISLVVNNLEKDGYVIKNCNPDDKRSKLISLSTIGNTLMSKLFPEHITLLRTLMNHLSEDAKEQLIEGLKKLGKGS